MLSESRASVKKEALFELIEIPEHFGPIQVTVDDHRIKTFAFTQDDYGPWYFVESTFGGRIGHASILTNDLLQLFTEHYEPNSVVGLHTQEETWYRSPIRLGETATLSGTYVEKYERRGKGYVVMEAEARGDNGRLLVRHRGVEIIRIQPGPVVGKATADGPERRVTGDFRHDIGPASSARLDLLPGTPLVPLEKRVTQEQMSVFSRCGMYVKNIHNDLDKARAGGLETPIVQGQQEFCYLAELLTGFFGEKWFTSGWQKVKFLNPLCAGEAITLGGAVVGAVEGSDDRRLEVEVWIRNRQGVMTAVGWASANVPQ